MKLILHYDFEMNTIVDIKHVHVDFVNHINNKESHIALHLQ